LEPSPPERIPQSRLNEAELNAQDEATWQILADAKPAAFQRRLTLALSTTSMIIHTTPGTVLVSKN